MKFALLFSTLLYSLTSVAGNGIERFVGINFEKAADLTPRSKQKLAVYLKNNCQPAASSASALSVKVLNFERIKVDQGIVDQVFAINVVFHGWDQYEHELAVLKVTDYAGQNPSSEWVEIEKIETSIEDLCK